MYDLNANLKLFPIKGNESYIYGKIKTRTTTKRTALYMNVIKMQCRTIKKRTLKKTNKKRTNYKNRKTTKSEISKELLKIKKKNK